MGRRTYYNRSDYRWIKLILSILVVIAGYYLYKNYVVFNPQQILDNSILKEKKFETNVTEIVSPKKKIKAYYFQDTTNPIISVDFMFKNAGLASDAEGEVGISNLVASLLTDGAGSLDMQTFKEELENKAIGLSFSANTDDFGGSLLTTKEHSRRAFELLNMVLMNPRFDEENIKRVKDEFDISFKKQQEHPVSVLSLQAAKEVYNNHPYGRNPLGEQKDIHNINRDNLLNFVKNHFTKSNLIVGIAGDVSEDEAGTILDEVFGNLPETGRIEFVREPNINFDGREKNINYQSPQKITNVFAKGVARTDADFYPMYVTNYILGSAGLSSRLSMAAREKEALTYNIYSYISLNDKSPLVRGGFASTAENFEKLQQIFRREWQKMGDKGVSKKELAKAKDFLIASYNLRFASITTISSMLVYMQKDNLGLDFLKKRNDYIRDVKIEDLNRVAKDIFNTKKMIFVNIGNFDKD